MSNFSRSHLSASNRVRSGFEIRALIDFTLSNARRFYSSMGNLLDAKGLSAKAFSKQLFIGNKLKYKSFFFKADYYYNIKKKKFLFTTSVS